MIGIFVLVSHHYSPYESKWRCLVLILIYDFVVFYSQQRNICLSFSVPEAVTTRMNPLHQVLTDYRIKRLRAKIDRKRAKEREREGDFFRNVKWYYKSRLFRFFFSFLSNRLFDTIFPLFSYRYISDICC